MDVRVATTSLRFCAWERLAALSELESIQFWPWASGPESEVTFRCPEGYEGDPELWAEDVARSCWMEPLATRSRPG